MQAKAEARYIRVSPQKARLVVDLIRGQQAGAAINMLRTTNKRIAPTVEKVLRSAIANAENRNEDVDVDTAVRDRSVRERRAAHEAGAPGADGARLPLSAALGAHRRQSGGQRGIDGTESSSVRIPAGLQQAVAFALVRQAGLRQAAAGRSGVEGGADASRLKIGWRQLDRSRSAGQQAARHHSHLAPRHHHRPQGRRDRKAQAGYGEEDQARSLHRHSGSSQARARCATGFANRSRCSSKSAWPSAAPCVRPSIRRCASAARESRFACPAA